LVINDPADDELHS
jgi:hypothetical protein